MADLSNVRLFVIDALKKYHAALSGGIDNALTTTLSDFVSKEYAASTYLTKADAAATYITYQYAGSTYLTKADAAATYITYEYAGSTYVAKENGKGLSTEDFTTAYKTKLEGIEDGAEVNVNADWDASSGDAQILHKPNIAGLFGYAYYDTTNHRISFSYSSSSAELYNIDCSSFIIDGMIDSVSIEQYSEADQATNGLTYLFIDFNIDAENGGHTDIKIPLQNIFNPNNYYTKSEMDTTLSTTYLTKADAGTTYLSKEDAANTYLTKAVAGTTYLSKADAASTYLTKADAASTYITYQYAGSTYVAKETGKGLSTNDFTTAYMAKLDSIEDNAQVNVIEEIQLNGTALQVNNKSVNVVIPAAATVSFSGSKSADVGDFTYVPNGFSANDHQITVSYTAVLKSHQDISGKEDKSNKKDAIIGNEASSAYYASTKAVATYVGSLEELSASELNEIFGLTTTP